MQPWTESLGLEANGISDRWEVALNGALDRDEWFLELNGPTVYLVVALPDRGAVERARRYLADPRPTRQASGFALGRMGTAPVSLYLDNEDFVRGFVIIGPEEHSTVRLSLDADDIRMIGEAMDQVLEGMRDG